MDAGNLRRELKELNAKIPLFLGLLTIAYCSWACQSGEVTNPHPDISAVPPQPSAEFSPTATATSESREPVIVSTLPPSLPSPSPTATLDVPVEAYAQFRATDKASSREDILRDLEKLPAVVRQTAYLIDLANSHEGASCSGTLLDVRPHPGDSSRQIMIFLTAGHCLNDKDGNFFDRAEFSQPHEKESARIYSINMAVVKDEGDMGIIAIETGITPGVVPLGMDQVSGSPEFSPGQVLPGLGFFQNPQIEGSFRPEFYTVIDGIPVPAITEDSIRLEIIQAEGSAVAGMSGFGLFDSDGRLVGVYLGPGNRSVPGGPDRIAHSVSPVTPMLTVYIQQAFQDLLREE